ncbi:uncharacterized protein LOC100569834 [Acyrthosiphon pisum]|uniref:USP domain-containing protein n=1 Tax=Acyrthosiphon pisum TaxID=7029 RepID=A0A8R2D1I0_ACYPI|nr:uncharacterized protein LOC100569834 [Acyrthosiphon pisum]
MHYLNPETRSLEYDTTQAICDATAGNVIDKLFIDFPSLKEITECSSNVCLNKSYMNYNFITFQTDIETNISQLQQYLNDRTSIKEHQKCSNEKCDGIKKTKFLISPMHLFIDVLFWEGEDMISSQRSSEAATLMKLKLCDIPQILTHSTKNYELRGVLCFYKGKGGLRSSVGHYTAYTKRYGRNWELFDDLKKKPIPVKETTTVNCEFLVYTV